MSEHERAREQHRSRIGAVLARDVESDVTAAGLEQSDVATQVGTGDNTRSTDETSADVLRT